MLKKTIVAVAASVLFTAAAFAQSGSVVGTGNFKSGVHETSGRATVYQGTDGANTLRLTNFKTSDGPDVHVLLVAAPESEFSKNSFAKSVKYLELGKLKGTEGDQNYAIPAGTDLSKYKGVAIYCVRFSANFGAAPLEK